MQQLTAVVLLLVILSGANGASVYPKFSHVFMDPESFNLLRSTTSGPVNETMRFTRAVRLTSVVVPAQYINCAGQQTYDEDIAVSIILTTINAPVAEGRFRGTVRYGQEVHVPISVVGSNGTLLDPPTMLVWDNYKQYIFSFSFGKSGIYPWYLKRPFSSSGTIHNSCDVAGFMIGFAYTLV